ncbi:membrane protein [Hypericibacter terrae]|uniref:Membrane protein n=1 Tax=Hypericibacter terrae TaxID=2602015 RepID=A0A5J6MKG5_9PROT|nr:ArsB/NhaD family transporter [Hypericibacter terrae]QEX17005.1 membrane protein [Hypericibacter terrae]
MEVDAVSHATVFGLDPLWLSSAILILSYASIMTERVNRAIVALVGAGVMIISGVLDQNHAVAGIDFNTIALLTGMMLLVAISKRSGMFQYVAIWSAKVARGSPWGMLALLTVVTAVASALLDNVTTVLLMAPVTLVITQQLKVPPYPFLFTEILASNIGGTATLIGDPPNIIIGSATGLTFNDFALNLGPVVLIVLAVQIVINHLIWGRKMQVAEADRARVLAFRPVEAINDRPLLWKSLFVLALVIGGFILAHSIHLEPGSIAMLGAALLLLLENLGRSGEEQSHAVHQTFSEVEWITIFFFVGLFVIVAGVEHAGLLGLLAAELIHLTGGDLTTTTLAILWASAILSAIIDNIPFVATMIPVIKDMAPTFGGPEGLLPLWWALSLGACLGGNGTLIGASANLTVAGIGERAGVPFRFVPFLLLAFPMMIVSILISTAYVYFRYL